MSSADAKAELESFLASSAAPDSFKFFRLLIIGKTGCGKTTILGKVCGGNMVDAPSTTRGIHNIEEEIKFDKNDKMVAHDSEGFEAGRSNEVNVVKDFIERRSKMTSINDKLHVVWYCMEMNSRPIQHAEKEFFSTPSQVPVVAIVTKFDVFIQDVQQKMEEVAEEEDSEIDDNEIEERATKEAMARFEQHYKQALESLPHPPKAVVALSEVQKSNPDDSRLAHLVQVTIEALPFADPFEHDKGENLYDLRAFFAAAQDADTATKLTQSTRNGLLWNYDRKSLPFYRNGPFIRNWPTVWSEKRRPLQDALQMTLDNSPRLIGHPKSPYLTEVRSGDPDLLRYCQWEQMVADTVLVMEKVYVHDIRDEGILKTLIKWYAEHSTIATYVRGEIMEIYRARRYSGWEVPLKWTDDLADPLIKIVRNRPRELARELSS